jgi:hypothetical protein
MEIPFGLAYGLSVIPKGGPVALIVRHSIRGEIPAGQTGNDVPLTPDGRQLAETLGAALGSRLASISSSPIGRCMQTAEGILTGSGHRMEVSASRLLGDPGVFVEDGQAAWTNFQALGTEGVMMHLALTDTALPGMRSPKAAAILLLESMMAKCAEPGLHLFVTHDVILAGVAGQLLQGVKAKEDLPGFLEGAFFWKIENTTYGCYRHRLTEASASAACQSDDSRIS